MKRVSPRRMKTLAKCPRSATPTPAPHRGGGEAGGSRSLLRCNSGRQCFGRDLEWVDDPKVSEPLVLSEVFGEKGLAVCRARGRHDEGIPPGEPMAILKVPSVFHDARIYVDRLPGKQETNIPASSLWIESGGELVRDGKVELLQNLETQTPQPHVPEARHPGHGPLLLSGLGRIPGVHEYVGVHEDPSGHEAPSGWGTLRWVS
jgi:hypothetical protein